MKNTSRHPLLLFAMISTLLGGCASMAVTEDDLQRNTAFALGAEQNSFTIADRQDDGIKTSYRVSTHDGRRFNCYVTGTFSVVGRAVSDAVCSEVGRASAGSTQRAPAGKATPGTCNALLKAAGRC